MVSDTPRYRRHSVAAALLNEWRYLDAVSVILRRMDYDQLPGPILPLLDAWEPSPLYILIRRHRNPRAASCHH